MNAETSRRRSLPDPSTPTNLVFVTRVDAWLVILVGLALSLCFFEAWRLREASPAGSMAALGIGAFSLAAILAFTVPCRYTLEADHLFIRCGLIARRIPYSEMTRIALSTNVLSAPALSLQRVRIDHGRSFQLVSPRDRKGFVEALSRRAGLET